MLSHLWTWTLLSRAFVTMCACAKYQGGLAELSSPRMDGYDTAQCVGTYQWAMAHPGAGSSLIFCNLGAWTLLELSGRAATRALTFASYSITSETISCWDPELSRMCQYVDIRGILDSI